MAISKLCIANTLVFGLLFAHSLKAQSQHEEAQELTEMSSPPSSVNMSQIIQDEIDHRNRQFDTATQKFGPDNFTVLTLRSQVQLLQELLEMESRDTATEREVRQRYKRDWPNEPMKYLEKRHNLAVVREALRKRAEVQASTVRNPHEEELLKKITNTFNSVIDSMLNRIIKDFAPPPPEQTNQPEVEIADAQAKYDLANQATLDIAAELRNAKATHDEPRTKELADKLRAAVHNAFDLRIILQRLQIDQAQNQLNASRSRIAFRQIRSIDIINRRIAELTADEHTQWDADDAAESGSDVSRVDIAPDPILKEAMPADQGYITLREAIENFNHRLADGYYAGRCQALTENEVVAAVRWAAYVDKIETLDDVGLRAIADRRILPNNWSILILEEEERIGRENATIIDGNISLICETQDGKFVEHPIREQLLSSRLTNADGSEKPTEVFEPRPNFSSLATAIRTFNEQHQSLDGRNDPPLSVNEVVAAIRSWRDRREALAITNEDYDTLMFIGESKQMPPGASFELVTRALPPDGYEYTLWSIKLNLESTHKSSDQSQYSISIRRQFVRCNRLVRDSISWGPVGQNMIQVGIELDSPSRPYKITEAVRPTFYYRNLGATTVSAMFPRVLTRHYYSDVSVATAKGSTVLAVANEQSGKPIEWESVNLPPDGIHKISGKPLQLGGEAIGNPDLALNVQAGETYTLQVQVPDYLSKRQEPLITGAVTLQME